MHLARQAGLVARAAQVMGEGRDVGGEFGGVVVDPRAARQAGPAMKLARPGAQSGEAV
jgi:hypothetical protein